MKKYFYSNGKEKHGPLGLDELKQEDISDETLIWFEGLDDWTPAGDLDEMEPILELQPPPILSEEKRGVTLSEGYLEYEKARDFILLLKFTSRDGWNNYSKSVLKPGDIPARPEIVYEGIGWVSWEHWLGANYESQDRPSEDKPIKQGMFSSPFSFEGRIRRREFGISFIIFNSVYAYVGWALGAGPATNDGTVFVLIHLPMYWFFLAQSAKRCHDVGHNGFWQFIPFYVFWLLFQNGKPGINEYGPNPKG